MTKLEGKVVLTPPNLNDWLDGMVYALVQIHRGYHPTNILWENDKVSGVVTTISSVLARWSPVMNM